MPALLGKKNDSTQSSNNDLSAKIQELTQSLNNEKDRKLCKAIYRKVTKENHNYPSPQKGDKTITECIEFLKAGADPEVLSGLAESLSKQIESEKLPKKKEEYQKYYKYYIKTFLPALKTEVMVSLELFKLPVFNKEAEQPQRPQTIRGKILKIISGITNGGNNKSHPNSTIRNQGPENSGTNSKKELEKLIETPKPSDDPNPPVLNKKSPLSSPVSGRRGSISTTLSSVRGDNDLQREEIEDQPQPPKQNPEEKPKKQENENSDGQANPIGNGNPQKRNEGQPQLEQPAKKEQNTQENENSKPTKQPNNRNFHIALATCCAFSVGCLIAGVVTLGMVGAGLFVMSVVFAIAAAVTRYLPPPSSELISTDLSPLIDDSKHR